MLRKTGHPPGATTTVTEAGAATTTQPVPTNQKYPTQKTPVKLNPIMMKMTSTNSKPNEQLEFIALHKPLHQKSTVTSKPVDLNESLNKFDEFYKSCSVTT